MRFSRSLDARLFLFYAGSNASKEVMPLKFVNTFRTAFPMFAQRTDDGRGYMQQDAEECWSTIVNDLSQSVRISHDAGPSNLVCGQRPRRGFGIVGSGGRSWAPACARGCRTTPVQAVWITAGRSRAHAASAQHRLSEVARARARAVMIL
jgi:hypothetical protein